MIIFILAIITDLISIIKKNINHHLIVALVTM